MERVERTDAATPSSPQIEPADARGSGRRLAAMRAVGILAASPDLESAAGRALAEVAAGFGWTAAVLWRTDPQAGCMRCVEVWTEPDARPTAETFETACRTDTFSLGDELPGRVWASGRAEAIEDLRGEADFRRGDAALRAGLNAAVAIPLSAGPAVLGVLEGFGPGPVTPSPEDLEALGVLAAQLSQLVERVRAEADARAAEAHRRATLLAAFDPILTLDAEGRIIEANPAAERVFGFTEAELTGRPVEDLIEGDVSGAPSSGRPIELVGRRASGTSFPVQVTLVRVEDSGDQPRFTASIRDMSDRRRAQERLRHADAMYQRLVEQIPAVVYIDAPNESSSTIYISPQITPLTGYEPAEWRADPELWVKLLHAEDRERVMAESIRTNASGEPFVSEYRLVARDGRVVWVRDEATLVRDEQGRGLFWQGVILDVTERKRAEEQVQFLAYHDPLTGLPNRSMLEELIELDVARARRHDLAVSGLYVDLDGFKLVNDSLGHEAGDELLRQVSARLTEATRETDVVARIGGDEFFLLLSDLERVAVPSGVKPDSATVLLVTEGVASRIQEVLRLPFTLGDTEVYVSASIGISVFPLDAEGGSTLLKHADAAMYRSKRRGPGRYLFFPTDTTDPRNKLSLATRLRHAVDEEAWVLHYQPILDLAKGEMVGVEALLRWQVPQRGLLPPEEFVPLAEEMGLLDRIGDWVLEEICRQSVAWRERGLDLELSFNLSPRQLWHPDLPQRIASTRAESEAGDCRLVIEITETTAMTDPDRTEQVLLALREEGIRVAIDDFGTGYSSLGRLKDLPVDVLKIDRSFVRDLPHDMNAVTMVRAMIQLARGLGMTPLAEGIESEAQWRFLVAEHCSLGQGYFFSYPLPGDDIGHERFAMGAGPRPATASRVS